MPVQLPEMQPRSMVTVEPKELNMTKKTKAILKTAKLLQSEKRGSFQRIAIAGDIREARHHGIKDRMGITQISASKPREAGRRAQVRGLKRLNLGVYDPPMLIHYLKEEKC